MSHRMRKPTIRICENKGADKLHGNREADQRLCFRYKDSTVSLLLKSERRLMPKMRKVPKSLKSREIM